MEKKYFLHTLGLCVAHFSSRFRSTPKRIMETANCSGDIFIFGFWPFFLTLAHYKRHVLILKDKIVYDKVFIYCMFENFKAIQRDVMSILPKCITKYPNVLDSSLMMIYIYIYTYIYIYLYVCMYVYIYICIYIYTVTCKVQLVQRGNTFEYINRTKVKR